MIKKLQTLTLISDIQLLWSSASRNPILCLGFSFILFKIIFPLSHFSGKLQIYFFFYFFENVRPPLFALSLFFRLKNWLKVSNQKSAYQSVIHSGLFFQIKVQICMKLLHLILSGALKNFENCRHDHFNSKNDCSDPWN